MSKRVRIALILWSLALPEVASANGLTTHVWISRRAVELLPPGELKTLLSKPELTDYLVSGTIFPDGGYAVGDGYGELAHWEPFQLAYLEHIRASYSPPFSDPEAQKHLAFFFGLASHGMADQVFDSLYMQRAKQLDAASDWATKSFDEATDVVWASITGAQPVPPRWVPVEIFADLFERTGHHTVEAETMLRGQNLAGFAVAVVGMLAQDREAVRDYKKQFPWGTEHLADELVPGRPEAEAELVARYWQRHWARLHGTPAMTETELILGTVPADGAGGLGRDAMSVESRITIAFARRFMRDAVTKDAFAIEDSQGRAIAFDTWLFYGNDSHVVHLVPEEDLIADETYTVTVSAGLAFAEGISTPAPFTFRVSTKGPMVNSGGEAGGCRCVAGAVRGSRPGVLMLGLMLGLLLAIAAPGAKRHFRGGAPK